MQDRVADTLDEVKPHLRGWLHAATAPLAFIAFLVLLTVVDSAWIRFGIAIFMVSALALFTTSAIYHTGTWTQRRRTILKRLDHANIFILIAGSCTPFALLLLTRQHAVILIITVWSGALLGVLFKVFWLDAPRWLYVPLYLALGWAPILFVGDFLDSGQTAALVLLAAGGLLYSVGAVVYGIRRPDPSPTYFGFHEVFHTLTILAFTAHFIGIALLV
ncbi:DNA-binding protein [Aeromicrobium sp. Root495]|nr:DNA-binding protein [Aeromicrobium sp. Root495]